MNEIKALEKFVFPEKIVIKRSISFPKSTQGVKKLIKYLEEYNIEISDEISEEGLLSSKNEKCINLKPEGKIIFTKDRIAVVGIKR